MNWLLVFLGGGAGSVARYALGCVLPAVDYERGHLPWATMGANLLACFVLGVGVALVGKAVLSRPLQWLLLTGFCGGFSTFSTFSGEIVLLLEEGHVAPATLYVLLSLLGGGLAFLAAYWLTR